MISVVAKAVFSWDSSKSFCKTCKKLFRIPNSEKYNSALVHKLCSLYTGSLYVYMLLRVTQHMYHVQIIFIFWSCENPLVFIDVRHC